MKGSREKGTLKQEGKGIFRQSKETSKGIEKRKKRGDDFLLEGVTRERRGGWRGRRKIFVALSIGLTRLEQDEVCAESVFECVHDCVCV